MYFSHSFTAPIGIYDFGKYFYTVVYIPNDVTNDLPMKQHPRLRVEAEIDSVPVEGTLMPDQLGSAQTKHLVGTLGPEGQRLWYLMTPRKLLKSIGKAIGDDVDVRLRMADQDAVAVPEALAVFLSENGDVAAVWDSLTPGKRRGYAHQIATAKTFPTIKRRLQKLANELLGRHEE